jgi:hypothetical protein
MLRGNHTGDLVPVQLPPIDDDVYAALQARAVPLVDDVNSVLRRLLGLSPRSGVPQVDPITSENGSTTPKSAARKRSGKTKSAKKRTRAPKGSILPEADYELPILRVLERLGGRGPTSEVIAAVENELGPKLTDVDREPLAGGDVRWKNRAQFVRLKLVEKGEMAAGSPRGTWEISELGRRRVAAEG